MGGECRVWEGMEGGVVWSGMKEVEEEERKVHTTHVGANVERSGRLGMGGDENSVGQN